MKLNIRLIALLLSLITVFGLLCACTDTPPETEITDPQTTEAIENTEPEETTGEETSETIDSNVFDLITNGASTVRIIRSSKLNTEHYYVQAAIKIRNKIEDTTGIKLDMYDDYKKPSEVYDNSTLEILVGKTGYDQFNTAIADLSYGDYTIKAIGNKIVIFGFTEDAMNAAANEFIKLVAQHETEENEISSVSIPRDALNIVNTHAGSKVLSALPYYDGATFSSTYQSNLDCDELILSDATAENYAAYIEKLQSAGYTKYTDNDINGNLFTTLYNKDYTLNVGFYKPYKECRIIMEPFAEESLIGLESDNKYTPVTTSQVTMLGCEYQKSDGSYVGNGLSLLFRLADGSFVIVDGGHTTNSSTWANNLVTTITAQAKEYATGKDIRIAAWFVSHAHGDHNGMLTKQAALFNRFTVERVIACFMTDEERNKANASNSPHADNWSDGEGGSDDSTISAAATMGADFIVCHVGQRFFFADTVFEILYTVESYGPQLVNALNTSTILVRAITTDASGKSSSMMIMGDVTGPAMAICNKMYGISMACDIVQVAHHGYTTWGNNDAMATSYKYMSPKIVLWPQGSSAFPNYKEKSYNKVLWDGTNKNFQQMYVAGWNNTQHIVPLPYSGDPATIVSNITKKS